MSSSNRDRSREVREGIQVDSNHPIAGRVLNFLTVCVIESQADISHRAAVANFLKLFPRKYVPAACDQRGRLNRANAHKRNREFAKEISRLLNIRILQQNVH